jgi:hypothetical protein
MSMGKMAVGSGTWRIGTSLLFAAGLAILATACSGEDADLAATRLASTRLGASNLRVTERSDLSTERHAVFRITERGGARQLMVAVASGGDAVLDSSTSDAFASLARAEDLGARFDQLGAKRVAGWFGSFGGGACGEPILTGLPAIRVQTRADGGHELRYRFAEAGRVEECHLVLDGRGVVERVSRSSMNASS